MKRYPPILHATSRLRWPGLFLLLLISTPPRSLPADPPPHPVTITLAHTADLQAQFLPVADPISGEPSGGCLQTASLIRTARARHPNLILVDCGNMLLGSFAGVETEGRLSVSFANALSYDFLVPGKKDFALPPKSLRSRWTEMRAQWLLANATLTEPIGNMTPFAIVEREGVRIALIGVTSANIPSWIPSSLLPDMQWKDPVAAVKDLLQHPSLKDVHARILIANQGWLPADDRNNRVNSIVEACPTLDIVLGGGTPTAWTDIRAGNTLYTQAGERGRSLGLVHLTFDGTSHQLQRKTAQLLRTTTETPSDPELQKTLQPVLGVIQRAENKILAHVERRFPSASESAWPAAIAQLLARSVATSEKLRDPSVVGAIVPTLDAGITLPQGPLLYREMMEVVPQDLRVGSINLTAGQIRTLMETIVSLSDDPRHPARTPWGLSFIVDPKSPKGHRVLGPLDGDGKPLPAVTLLRVAFVSSDIASAGQALPLLSELSTTPEAHLLWNPEDLREIVRRQLTAESPLRPHVEEWVRFGRIPGQTASTAEPKTPSKTPLTPKR